MAEQEEDFSSLPLTDRWIHKNWKVRKEAYEAAAKLFDNAQSENDATVRTFLSESSLWKGAVGDSNVAAQQEALGALCSFLQIGGVEGCRRTRGITITPIVEKGLGATRPQAKQKALEALMLYIEIDKPDPVIEELLPHLSHKQPKIIVATLSAITAIFHAFGCRTVEPKSTLKALPKVFGHADKKVREEAQNLTVEFYRWLRESMKPLFWNDLKPVQQQDLDKLFEKVKDEPPPKQERLLRSQQNAVQKAGPGGDGAADDEGPGDEEDVEIDLEPEYMAVDVTKKIPKDFQERLASSKWKDRKDALDDLFTAINHPKIEEGPFDDIIRGLAKSMKDANIAVVTVAANCVERFANGLKKSFSKYRSNILSPMMERLKEKKQSVADALGAALDAVCSATSLGECLTETLECLTHKNPQVKLETTRFLIRSLRNTRDAPQPPEVKSIADAATKLLTDSQEVQRSAGAEVLGTLWKIMGDRVMNPHLDGLDEIRKTKIKEYYESAEVKAKFKPKTAAPAAKGPPAGLGQRKPGVAPAAKKAPAAVKKPPPRPVSPPFEDVPTPASRPAGKPASGIAGASKLARPKSGLVAPGSVPGLKRPGSMLGPPAGLTSPRRAAPPTIDEPASPPQAVAAPGPKLGLAGRGLTGRPLGKPVVEAPYAAAPAPAGLSGLGTVERAELEELRAEVERLRRQNEEIRQERVKMSSQIHELQNQNAQLIEDHTRDVLSIKAKETQLVRARSDAEAAEQTVQSQRREVERMKREMGRLGRDMASATSPTSGRTDSYGMGGGGADIYNDLNGSGLNGGMPRSRGSYTGGSRPPVLATTREEQEGKENYAQDPLLGRKALSPVRGLGLRGAGSPTSTRPGLGGDGFDGENSRTSSAASGMSGSTLGLQQAAGGSSAGGQGGTESWKRAAEVTQNLKARIELMKAKQGLSKQ